MAKPAKIITAEDVVGTPDLYNRVYRIGRGKYGWECTGSNRDQTKVRFARIIAEADGLRQITIYVEPSTIVHPEEE